MTPNVIPRNTPEIVSGFHVRSGSLSYFDEVGWVQTGRLTTSVYLSGIGMELFFYAHGVLLFAEHGDDK